MTQPGAVDPLFLAFQQALAGRYSIDRELGRGGMGIVYLAREVHLDRPVAIKLLPPERAGQPGLRERLNGGGTLLGGFGLLIGATTVSGLWGGWAGLATLLGGATVVPLGYFVAAARRLLRRGFGHPDLGPAFAAEIEQAKEELAVEHRRGPSQFETMAGFVAKASAAVFGASLITVFGGVLTLSPLFEVAALALVLSGVVVTGSTLSLLALRQRHRDVDTEFWSKVWMGRIGKLAFSIGRKLLGKRVPQMAMTYRATELALGMAAEQLYERLPKESRQALHDLPAVLRRLQEDAHALRRHYDEMQEALGDAGEAASSAAYAEVRAMRDAVHTRLGEAVGALETIRLNLLRLHAGSATVEGLTTHLGLAAEVADEVARLIAAHEDVERTLRFPRLTASTPS